MNISSTVIHFGMLFQADCLSKRFVCLDFGGIDVYPTRPQSYGLSPKCLFGLNLCTYIGNRISSDEKEKMTTFQDVSEVFT